MAQISLRNNNQRQQMNRRRDRRAAMIASLGMCLVLLVVLCLSFLLPTNRHTHRQHHAGPLSALTHGHRPRFATLRKRGSKQQHRIAFVLPFVGQGNVDLPPYLTLFCVGAASAASIADFIIVHNGVSDLKDNVFDCPPNVIFLNLQSSMNMADHLVRVVDHKEDDLALDRHRLVQLVATHLQVYPYCLVEFKPALGHIFADYLPVDVYTHWGYSDLDMLFGDLERWTTGDELTKFDLVTYGFGDQQRLYLRGQFTIHRNDPTKINQLWRDCDYLTNLDQRLAHVMNRDNSYHFESAEGCYSAAILKHKDIKVKYAVKAWTDISEHDTSYTHGLWISRNAQTGRHVIYKAATSSAGKALLELPPSWHEQDETYKDTSIELQKPAGSMQELELPNDPEVKCMYWVQKKYQRHLCLKEDLVSSNDTLYWIDGLLYRQAHMHTPLQEDSVVTGPFFHFQEWKRYFRANQLTPLHLSSDVSTFVLTKEGVIPLVEEWTSSSSARPLATRSSKRRQHDAISPAPLQLPHLNWAAKALKKMKNKKDAPHDDSWLPNRKYCLVSGPRKVPPRPPAPDCYHLISWRSKQHVEILHRPKHLWSHIDVEREVTLTLTLQIKPQTAASREALSDVVEILVTNLKRWQSQPSVVVIHVASVAEEAMLFLRHRFTSDLDFESSLIAVLSRNDPGTVSRKALLNMAMDAVPTRWFVTGVELERGLALSMDAVAFAHRAAATHHSHDHGNNTLAGSVWIVPQFAVDGETESRLGLNELASQHRRGLLKTPSETDEAETSCNYDDLVNPLDAPSEIWWKQVNEVLAGREEEDDDGDENDEEKEKDHSQAEKKALEALALASKQAEKLVDLELSFLELATNEHHLRMYALDESPILMIDNKGPRRGMRTDELVRDIEELGGRRCYNGLRLSQLAALGYRLDVLVGAFALSTHETRRAAEQHEESLGWSRCDGCFMFADDHEDILENIVKDEIRRPAKAAVLWMETDQRIE